jgi:hypothetical protein
MNKNLFTILLSQLSTYNAYNDPPTTAQKLLVSKKYFSYSFPSPNVGCCWKERANDEQ